jgi:hypothetical protein
LAVNDARFRPPLSRAEVTGIAGRIAAAELKRRANS